MSYTYDPSAFLCVDEGSARELILTPFDHIGTEERWERETTWLIEQLRFPDCSLVIDYGCGIGRLARLLQPAVLGVDISPTMRMMADSSLQRPDFAAVSPLMLWQLVHAGLRVDGALAVWCLQHANEPALDISLLAQALVPGGTLYVVNEDARLIPSTTESGEFVWCDDMKDIDAMIRHGGFICEQHEPMPETLCPRGAWFARYSLSHGD